MSIGYLAQKYCKTSLELRVLKSGAGYYIGTCDEEGPVSRESMEYWSSQEAAEEALFCSTWTQRTNP